MLRASAQASTLLLVTSAAAFAQGSCLSTNDKLSISGTVLDARSNAALEGALAAVDWDDLTLSRGILQSSHHQARALTDKAGRFSLCSLPVESPLRLRISADGFRQFETELALPPDGVLRHTFRLADEKLATGTGSIAARVVDSFAG